MLLSHNYQTLHDTSTTILETLHVFQLDGAFSLQLYQHLCKNRRTYLLWRERLYSLSAVLVDTHVQP